MLQHVAYASADGKTPRCPLCADRLQPGTLKPCLFSDVPVPSVGQNLALRLISRKRGSMLCYLHESPPHPDSVPILGNQNTTFYSRIAFAKHSLLLRIIKRFKNELIDVISEDPALTPFVNSASTRLDDWARAIHVRKPMPSAHVTSIEQSLASIDTDLKTAGKTTVECDISRSQTSKSISTSSNSQIGILKTANDVDNSDKELWYFYQEEASSNVFLHPINHRVLSTEYGGNFDSASRRIEGKVLQIEAFTMTESLRKRYRFLDHLPDGCEFAFVELELTHLLSECTLSAHGGEISDRKRTRKKREDAMAKESRRIERRQSESLLEYFNSHGDRVISSIPNIPVDRNDIVSFPALHERKTFSGMANGPEDGLESLNSTGDAINTSSHNSPSDSSAGWESGISSYSSVTSKMGLFPTLGSSPGCSGKLRGAWGSSSQMALGNSSTDTHQEGRNNTPSNAEEPRRGRKSHSKTIVMSNAGLPYRR